MPAINYKFSTDDQVYFLDTLPEGTRVLVHVTDNILACKILSVNMNIHIYDGEPIESVVYDIITTNLTSTQSFSGVSEKLIFKTRSGALCAASKEIESRRTVLQEDMNKRVGVLDKLITSIKFHNQPE